ncbi:phosphoglycerate kinase [Nematocida sp. LUAm3]|nr:phosphoglycerate kinase [Nematocida sp. LUAm3]KAI5175232.1 phosphoglycerate kinase [Nematocida sp. LUAm2]KAI5178096.1 phosphoglycerate kinase [Nematocida sp. LUAm1]
MKIWTHEVYVGKKGLSEVELEGKRVFLRVDYNVPIQGSKVTDSSKILGTISTLQFLLKKKVKKIFIATHLGRPEACKDPINHPSSGGVEPLVEALNEELRNIGEEVTFSLKCMEQQEMDGNWIFLQNLRTLKVEKDLKDEVSKRLFDSFTENNCDIMVNDAFGVMHRRDYSVTGVHLEKVPGLLVDAEMQGLSFLIGDKRPSEGSSPTIAPGRKEVQRFLEHSQDPNSFLFSQEKPIDLLIIGGCKLEDKILIVKNLSGVSSNIFLGGLLGLPFEEKKISEKILEIVESSLRTNTRIFLPLDYRMSNTQQLSSKSAVETDPHGVRDIGEETEKFLRELVDKSKRLFWNGTVGKVEEEKFALGTNSLISSIKNRRKLLMEKGEQTVFCVGGGDTAGYVNAIGEGNSFDFLFTGGGATLEALEGKILPGIEALSERS